MSKSKRQSAALKRQLVEQGRSQTWLATATGYSRAYVTNVVNGRLPWTEQFQRAATEALAAEAVVAVTYRGKTVRVPENFYRKASSLPLVVVESVYEEAWKKAWVQEHGQITLAAAADRAWNAAAVLSAA